jgi:hypothetical protein
VVANDPEVVARRAVANMPAYLSSFVSTFKNDPVTHTVGAVFHATRWLGVFYNEGTNNGEPNQVASILPYQGLPPPSNGKTNDYGFMLTLLDGKFFLRATVFETSLQTQVQGVSLDPLRAPTLAILDALLANNRINAATHQQHVLNPDLNLQASYDTVNSGFELSNWFHVSRNLTGQVNFSYTKTDRSNVGPEFDGWFAAEKEFWLQTPGAGNLVNTTAASTVNQSIEAIEAAMQEIRNFNNFGFGNNPYKANVSGRYSFTEGRLRGIFVGGGSRWVSKAKIGRETTGRDARGNTTYGKTFYGPEEFKMDAFLGYRRTIDFGNQKARLTLQLNVSNLTNEDDVMPLRLNAHYNGYLRVLLPEPRRIRFTTALEF